MSPTSLPPAERLYSLSINRIMRFNPSITIPLLHQVTTVYDNDDAASTHASTIASAPSSAPPVFHLLRKSDVHAARVEAPSTDQLKVDIYSVGVIMDSKVGG